MAPSSLSPRSLSSRLILGAALWITLALVAAGFGLAALFREHVEAALEQRLENDLEAIAAALGPDAQGRPVLARRLPDPLYERPYSGHYWQVDAGSTRLRSRSLWDAVLALPDEPPAAGAPRALRIAGPAGQNLIVVERRVDLPAAPAPARIAVAASDADLAPAIAAFARMLAGALGLLGVGLVLAAVLQVRYGLRPLTRLRAALAALRGGRAQRIEGAWPAEVAPLADDLNAFIAHDAAVVARARAQASDLAHALKTKLAVLANEAGDRDDRLAREVRAHVAAMLGPIERHLARARAASSAGLPGIRADARAAAQELARTLAKLQRERALAIDVEGGRPAWFAGDREDLTEMLGNLMDNASKWARTRVRVRLAGEGADLTVAIDDDGPGLPADQHEAVFARGARLDETREGSGLGLAITRELTELYGGSVRLEASDLGGLRAILRLPRAPDA